VRAQEVVFALAGQSFYFDPPEGQPSGTPTVSVWLSTDDDVAPTRTATTGACSVDSVSTTLSATASLGDVSITVASASGLVIGRRYLLTNAGGEAEWIEVKSIASTTIGLRRPLLNDQTTDATLKGCRISIGVNTTWVNDVQNIIELDAGYAGYRLRWAYTVASVARIGVSYADLTRYAYKNLVSPLDVDTRFPGWIDRLPPDYQEDQGVALVDEAFHAVRMDALGDEQVVRRIRNTEVLRELVIYRAAWLAIEHNAMLGAANAEAIKVVEDAYQRRYNQLLRAPKFPTDEAGGGAGGESDAAPIWRR
jgi:hypothetical protein